MTVAEITREALDLDMGNKVLLANVLLATVDETSDVWFQEWSQEAERRAAQVANGEAILRDYLEVKADIQARFAE